MFEGPERTATRETLLPSRNLIPTLSLQKRERQGWGNLLSLSEIQTTRKPRRALALQVLVTNVHCSRNEANL
jgi:hypothetical protein